MTLRLAVPADADALTVMGTEFLMSGMFGEVDDPAARARLATMKCLNDGFGVVAEADGVLVGMLGVLPGPHPLTGVMTGFEVAWWVMPGVRGTVGVRLLREAKAMAYAHGCAQLLVGSPSARISQLLEREGGIAIETTHCFHLQPVPLT